MKLYWPSPNPPCKPKGRTHRGKLIDGDEIEGWWVERENWQGPNTYHLFCLTCCVEKMPEWSNRPNVDTEGEARGILYE